ncbi:hypothetical protein CEXT_260701 [Caerostris extrusa]|uniref:serine--tRNA ligase n=1 Tax=Caerostris extrusa TaxID=172846 RepID=A0AAV4XEN9_CAEEX|nr:hypothetical protein CEXT_260701 [Caerostris extrusa]
MNLSKVISLFSFRRNLQPFIRNYSSSIHINETAIDWEYYYNPSNFVEIANNVMVRKVRVHLRNSIGQLQELSNAKNDPVKLKALQETMSPLLYWFPNRTHPRVMENKSEAPVLLEKVGNKPVFTYFPANFSLTKRLNVLRTKNLGHMSGHKSYYLKDNLATMEQALVNFALSKLRKRGFQLVTVPDIIPKSFLENCGMPTENKHSQTANGHKYMSTAVLILKMTIMQKYEVFHIDDSWASDLCLSGTSEMALASYLSDEIHDVSKLPIKLCAASRCYRAEAKRNQKEKGIYRVHNFTKVEMFGITSNESGTESETLLEEFTSIQKEMYTELGLCFKILEMPPMELGLPAYHKIDMEAWIPTQKFYGEISSASNCTDYQSRRIGLKYSMPTGETKFCHTVNATACAIPRLLIAIFENFQNLDGSINVPEPLQKYMQKEIIKDGFKETMVSTRPIS